MSLISWSTSSTCHSGDVVALVPLLSDPIARHEHSIRQLVRLQRNSPRHPSSLGVPAEQSCTKGATLQHATFQQPILASARQWHHFLGNEYRDVYPPGLSLTLLVTPRGDQLRSSRDRWASNTAQCTGFMALSMLIIPRPQDVNMSFRLSGRSNVLKRKETCLSNFRKVRPGEAHLALVLCAGVHDDSPEALAGRHGCDEQAFAVPLLHMRCQPVGTHIVVVPVQRFLYFSTSQEVVPRRVLSAGVQVSSVEYVIGSVMAHHSKRAWLERVHGVRTAASWACA